MSKRPAAPPPPAEARRPTDSPHNIDAERAVLGALLLHSELYERVSTLRPRTFFRQAHQHIYAAMVRLLDAPDGAVELVTLANELEKRDELTGVGGKGYLTALVDGLPRSTNIVHYAGVVREKALYRGLIATGRELQRRALEEDALPSALIAETDQRLIELQRTGGDGRMTDVSTTVAWLLDDLQTRIEHTGELTGVPTGFPTLDQLTQGWQPADVIVIAARPSMGKTTFVVNSGVEAARAGKHVAMFSLEMRRTQIEYRILSQLSGVPLSHLLRGLVSEPEAFRQLAAATSLMEQLHLHVDDTPGRTVRDIRQECRRLRGEHGLDLVIIDYIQLMDGTLTRRGATRNEELTDISRKLKTLAGELEVPILVLSQLSRAGADRAKDTPKLSDLRDSGAIEQDADLVCFLHRANHRTESDTHFIIEKQRNGPTGAFRLTLQRDLTLFTDAGVEPEAAPVTAPPLTPEQAEEARMAAERKTWARRRQRPRR